MTLTVIGSSSKGNTYALQSSSETLVLEAGCRISAFKKVLNYQYRPIVGVLVSHVHGDHAKYVKEYLKTGAPLCANEDVINRLGNEYDITMSEGKTYKIGHFSVTPFSVYHDVPTFGFLIYHKEMGTLFMATDTFAMPYEFKNVDHWLIEANYDDEIIEDAHIQGKLDNRQKERIITSHMSLDNCIKNLQLSHAENSKTITLIHLSERHSDPKKFVRLVSSATGVATRVAEKGVVINLVKDDI